MKQADAAFGKDIFTKFIVHHSRGLEVKLFRFFYERIYD